MSPECAGWAKYRQRRKSGGGATGSTRVDHNDDDDDGGMWHQHVFEDEEDEEEMPFRCRESVLAIDPPPSNLETPQTSNRSWRLSPNVPRMSGVFQ